MATKLKKIILPIITFIFAVIFWYFLENLIYNGFLLNKFIFTLLFFILLTISFLICLILFKNRYLFLFCSFIIILPIIFFFELKIFYLIFIPFYLLILYIGFLKIKKFQDDQVKIDFGFSIQKGGSYFLNLIILIILIVFYYSPFVQNIENFQLPRFLSNSIIKFSQPIIQNYLPSFNLEKNIEELFLDLYLQSVEPPKDFSKLNYQNLIKTLDAQSLIKEQKLLLEKEAGIKLKGNEKMGDIVYDIFNKKIQEFALQNPMYFKLTLILILFSVLKILILPIKYLILFLTILIFKLFLSLKIIRIEKQTIEKEILIV